MGCGCGSRSKPAVNAVTVTPIPVSAESVMESSVPVVKSASYNILNVIKDKLTGKLEYVSKEVMDFRLNQCKTCDKLRIGMCVECGCIVEFKTRYAESTCPLNKW